MNSGKLVFYLTGIVDGSERWLYKFVLKSNQLVLACNIKNLQFIHNTVHEANENNTKRLIRTRKVKNYETIDLGSVYSDPNSRFDFITHHFGFFNASNLIKSAEFKESYDDKACFDENNILKINNLYFFLGDQDIMEESIRKIGERLGVPYEGCIFIHKNTDVKKTVGFIAIKHPSGQIFPIPEDDDDMRRLLKRRSFDFLKKYLVVNKNGDIINEVSLINTKQMQRLQEKEGIRKV